VLNDVLSDETFVDSFVEANQRNLGEAYKTVTACLKENEIPYIEGGAGFFVLIDLRKYLPADGKKSWEAEDRLWRFLATECKVVMLPSFRT
jgi:hypothetical protein